MAERPPSPRTPFVGRRHSLARIRSLLREHRLVTLTGVGGAGKTRLALRVADEPDPDLQDEVFWVELAPVEDPRLVGPTVCASLDVRPSAGLPPLEALVNRLGASRVLLVLDNCEHVVEASAELVESLLEHLPDLHVLTTSREALAVAGEVAWPVPKRLACSDAT
jgi:non-specific serine/threonine protein kinase